MNEWMKCGENERANGSNHTRRSLDDDRLGLGCSSITVHEAWITYRMIRPSQLHSYHWVLGHSNMPKSPLFLRNGYIFVFRLQLQFSIFSLLVAAGLSHDDNRERLETVTRNDAEWKWWRWRWWRRRKRGFDSFITPPPSPSPYSSSAFIKGALLLLFYETVTWIIHVSHRFYFCCILVPLFDYIPSLAYTSPFSSLVWLVDTKTGYMRWERDVNAKSTSKLPLLQTK